MTAEPLKKSNDQDSVSCSYIYNYTGDNKMFFFLGTYGQVGTFILLL